MPLTRDFRETFKARAEASPEFRRTLLKRALNCFFDGEPDIGKAMMRDYINATIGFQDLGQQVGRSPKSLMRMFSDKGNPRTDSLFEVIGKIQKHEGVHLEMRVE